MSRLMIRFAALATVVLVAACTTEPSPIDYCTSRSDDTAVCFEPGSGPRQVHVGTTVGVRLGSDSGTSVRVTLASYRPPEAYGLIAGAPYPHRNSPCRIIGANKLTQEWIRDDRLLVGCPTVEHDAMQALVDRGARQRTRIGAWRLFHVRS